MPRRRAVVVVIAILLIAALFGTALIGAIAGASTSGSGQAQASGAPEVGGARAAEPGPPYPHPYPSKPVQTRPCRPASGGGGQSEQPKPKVALRDLPKPLDVRPRTVDLAPVRGKGMWLTTWSYTDPAKVQAVIDRAARSDVDQIWVRTGGTRQGWYGTELLERVLPAAHAAGLAVVAWDFPFLSDPMADVARARRALEGTFAGHRIDAFSPDIETSFEGTFAGKKRVKLYLSHIRRAAGDMPIVSTVMRPTESQLRSYPYRAQVPYIDAFAPMVYWSCNEPGALTRESIETLARWRPVHVIGQSYDMKGTGGPHGVPRGKEIWRFLDVGNRSGAIGASLYSSDGAGKPQWKALARYPWQDRG